MKVALRKKELRRRMRSRLMAHSRSEKDNARLVEAIGLSEAFRRADRIGIFFPRPWEPDLLPLWKMRPEACCFPRVVGESLEFYRVESLRELAPGYRGIAEPQAVAERKVVDWSARSLLLVPGIGFDLRGGRLGSGAGFYDRFSFALPAQRWGVAWAFQIVNDELAQEPTDARMVALATELGISSFVPTEERA